MKQSEKSKLTYEKILNAAVVEFGTNSYDNASVNNICSDNNISKGLIYHNFKNKDELYLCCVKMCFKEITSFLSAASYDSDDFKENIKQLMTLRNQFFINHAHYSKIFFNAILLPPNHLINEINDIRKDFDNFNIQQYKKIIKSVTLRNGVTEEDALKCFSAFGEMFNSYFGNKLYKTSDFNQLINAHEMSLSKLLDIMLYGIIA